MGSVNLEKMSQPFAEDFKVLECECDFRGELSMGGLLRLVQQVGTDQCMDLGMDDDFYVENKAVFLLTRQAVKIYKPLRRGETVRLQTIGQAPQRAVYKRLTKIFDQTGELVAMADSRWVLVNTETWRIMRRPPEGFPAQWQSDVPEVLEQQIQAPGETESVGQLCAQYSVCDTNGHMNNTRYADAALSALPLETMRRNRATEMRIVYHREIPMGGSAELQRAPAGENSWYVSAERENHVAFECLFGLEKA